MSVLKHIEGSGVMLNITKCEFGKTSIIFLGHQTNQDEIRADPEKTLANHDMRAPMTVPKVRHFLGMANQLGSSHQAYQLNTAIEKTNQQGY